MTEYLKSLSDKRLTIVSEDSYEQIEEDGKYFKVEDVREFIQKDMILIWDLYNRYISWKDFNDKRDKLVGEKLIHSLRSAETSPQVKTRAHALPEDNHASCGCGKEFGFVDEVVDILNGLLKRSYSFMTAVHLINDIHKKSCSDCEDKK